jgi:hypothetical protein
MILKINFKILSFVAICLCGISSNLFAQNCGAPTNAPNISYEATSNAAVYDFYPICVNVVFHIVRNSNGTGGITAANTATMLNNLNTAFNPQNIFLINAGLIL